MMEREEEEPVTLEEEVEVQAFQMIMDGMHDQAVQASPEAMKHPMSFTAIMLALLTVDNPEWWGRMAHRMVKVYGQRDDRKLFIELMRIFVDALPERVQGAVEDPEIVAAMEHYREEGKKHG